MSCKYCSEDDESMWTEEEIRLYQEVLEKQSEDTGISIFDYMPDVT